MLKLIQDTCGALLIGSLVATTIYGITTLQTYFYYITFRNDGPCTRTLVPLVWIIDTLHVIFMCHAVYAYVITNYGNPMAMASGTWSIFATVAANLTLVCLVQSFFTYRIFKLCRPKKRWWLAGYICCLITIEIGFGITTIVCLYVKKRFDLIHQLNHVILPLMVFNVLTDVSIAASLCILLWGNRSGFEDTNTAINNMIVFLVNRCVLTSAVAISGSVVFLLSPTTLYGYAIDFTIGKLYAISLLATLNSRAQFRQKTEEFESTEMSTRFVVASRVGDHGMHVEVQRPDSIKAASVIREEWP